MNNLRKPFFKKTSKAPHEYFGTYRCSRHGPSSLVVCWIDEKRRSCEILYPKRNIYLHEDSLQTVMLCCIYLDMAAKSFSHKNFMNVTEHMEVRLSSTEPSCSIHCHSKNRKVIAIPSIFDFI